MAIFYHVSLDLKHPGSFSPRIPENKSKIGTEDDTTPRVCVCETIEGCLSAMPGGGLEIESLTDNQYYLKVFSIDTERLGLKKEDILCWDYLYQNNLVPDAEITQEHWILKPFEVEKIDSFLIRVTDWREESDDIIPYFVKQVADQKYSGDYLSAYLEELGEDRKSVV